MIYTFDRLIDLFCSLQGIIPIIPDPNNSDCASIFITTINRDLPAPLISSLSLWFGSEWRISDEDAEYDLPLSHSSDSSDAAGQKILAWRLLSAMHTSLGRKIGRKMIVNCV